MGASSSLCCYHRVNDVCFVFLVSRMASSRYVAFASLKNPARMDDGWKLLEWAPTTMIPSTKQLCQRGWTFSSRSHWRFSDWKMYWSKPPALTLKMCRNFMMLFQCSQTSCYLNKWISIQSRTNALRQSSAHEGFRCMSSSGALWSRR